MAINLAGKAKEAKGMVKTWVPKILGILSKLPNGKALTKNINVEEYLKELDTLPDDENMLCDMLRKVPNLKDLLNNPFVSMGAPMLGFPADAMAELKRIVNGVASNAPVASSQPAGRTPYYGPDPDKPGISYKDKQNALKAKYKHLQSGR